MQFPWIELSGIRTRNQIKRPSGICCLKWLIYISRGLREPWTSEKARPLRPFPPTSWPLPAPTPDVRTSATYPQPSTRRRPLFLPFRPVPAVFISIVYILVGMDGKGRARYVFLNIYDFQSTLMLDSSPNQWRTCENTTKSSSVVFTLLSDPQESLKSS